MCVCVCVRARTCAIYINISKLTFISIIYENSSLREPSLCPL